MSVLIIKARVVLSPQEVIEAKMLRDVPPEAPDYMVWRKVAVPSMEVAKVIEYDKTKSLVEMYDGVRYLVKETFIKVVNRWDEAKKVEENYNNSISVEFEEDGEDDND